MQFMNDAKVVHHNLTPDAIFVNAKGSLYEYNDYLPEPCQINLDYAAPEYVLDGEVSESNDIFSLGCLAYAIHNKGVALLQTFNNLRTYERKIQSLSTTSFNKMPVHLQEVIRRLLARYPSQRLTPAEFQNSKYFDNILVSTMKFLESFPEKTREEKSQFMKGLPRVLSQFPERVLRRKILPSLLEELKNHPLLPYTIPNVFLIVEQLNQREFCDLVLPSLKPVFNVRDPPQNMIVLLEKLDILQQKTPRETFRDDIMPLVYAAIEAPTAVVQEKALRIVPTLAESLDYTTVKNSLFPKVQMLFAQTTLLSVKVSCLICFHSMIKVIDKYTMQEKMVPLLKNIKTKEPAVMLATLAVYDELGKFLDKEIIATEILPQLWRMSFGPLLNLAQFQKFMKTIRELTTRVEEAHTRHLREVKSLEDQTKTTSSVNGNGVVGDDVSFEALVQGPGSQSKTLTPDLFSSEISSNPPSPARMTPPLAATNAQPPSNRSSFGSSHGGGGWHNTSTQNTLMPTLSPSSSPMRLAQPTTTTATVTTNASMNSMSRSSHMTSSTTSLDWSMSNNNTIPSLAAPPSFQTTPSLPPPSSTSSLMPTTTTASTSSGPNYNALRGMGATTTSSPSLTPTTLTPTTSRPSSMTTLQPLSVSQSSGQSLQPQSGRKSNNLMAFDPLG
ncbi:ARM repeat-containing protein [Lichtheimia hyalospora FSU 10163]|nr:ARM repeat-containing protein [Lichtheimia hyalospora FSU 10163]